MPHAHWHYVFELIEEGDYHGLVRKRARSGDQFTDRALNRLIGRHNVHWIGEPSSVLVGINGVYTCELRYIRMELIQYGAMLRVEREFKG